MGTTVTFSPRNGWPPTCLYLGVQRRGNLTLLRSIPRTRQCGHFYREMLTPPPMTVSLPCRLPGWAKCQKTTWRTEWCAHSRCDQEFSGDLRRIFCSWNVRQLIPNYICLSEMAVKFGPNLPEALSRLSPVGSKVNKIKLPVWKKFWIRSM